MKTYSFNNVIMLVQGQEITGWPEGDDAILCERLVESASHVIGIDGSMTMFISADRSGTIKFKLKQDSKSNELLTALITSQENGAFIPIFVQIRNTEGGEFISGTQGYIPKPSSIKFGGKTEANEWTIVAERLDIINLGQDSL